MRIVGNVRWLTCLVALLICSSIAASGQTETILYNFGIYPGDAYQPGGSLLMDSAGNLFGTTVVGSETLCDFSEVYGCGLVYELVKSPTGYTEKILYTFGTNSPMTDGASPLAGVIADADGNLYGTTTYGGSPNCLIDVGIDGCGTVFELVKSPSGYTEKLLHTFTGFEGAYPEAGVTMDAAGNLFGTAYSGGDCTHGLVYELEKSSEGYTFKILHLFGCDTNDGWDPYAGITLDSAGNLYGATEGTGANNGLGLVFELVNSGGVYTEKILYRFSGPDGDLPSGNLIFDASGNIYGTTQRGGDYRFFGTVFELVNSNGNYTEKVLYSFKGPDYADGSTPESGLVMDASGNLFGNTRLGGAGDGIVYELVNSSGTYVEQILHRFGETAIDGQVLTAPLMLDGAGNIYGTTDSGGNTTCFCGTVFEINPALTGPAALVSVSTLAFGSQPVHAMSAPLGITVTNVGKENLVFASNTIAGANSSDFEVSANTCNGAGVVPGETCSATITFTPSIVGGEGAILSIGNNAPSSPQTVVLSGSGGDFGVSVASGGSSSATVTQGGTATYKLSVSPKGGFSQTVSLSCTGAPSKSTCSVSPGSLVLDGSTPLTATVTVTTTATSATSFRLLSEEDRSLGPRAYAMRLSFAFGILVLVGVIAVSGAHDQRRPARRLVRIILPALLAGGMILSSCGGTNSAPPQNTGTPPGAYSLTVTATSGALSHPMILTLTVD